MSIFVDRVPKNMNNATTKNQNENQKKKMHFYGC